VPADFFPKSVELLRFLPEIILTVVGTLLMVLESIGGLRWARLYGNLSLAGLAGALAAAVSAYGSPARHFPEC
jgi:hypothetical protein